MTKKISIVALIVFCAILLIYFSFSFIGKKKKTDSFRVETFQSGNGWGYQIKQNDRTIIWQPYMPCVQGNKPFPSEKSAIEIGEIVISKIKSRGTPSITIDELHEKVDPADYQNI